MTRRGYGGYVKFLEKSPYDRGSADAYYGRRPDPHWYPEGIVRGLRVTDMTEEQVADYYRGYEQEEDRKEWE
tara:strand:+ start:498 stop:713 length:216 start_codon:yes stop_codon:yes gene_type:complete